MFPSGSQRDIPRRTTQDTGRPQSAWGVDRTEQDPEDYYPEAHLPKTASNPRRKIPYVSLDSDSSSDDCRVLIMDAVPLSIVPPDPTSPPDSGKRKASEGPSTNAPSASSRGGRRKGVKRGARKGSAPPRRQVSEEPSEDAEASAPARKKLKKTAGRAPFRRTVYDG